MSAHPAAPTAPQRADRAGDLVDHRYRLVEVVGRGGLAVVWRAVDERLRRAVAVKLFKPDTTDPAREQAELEVMARLAHPNLVTMYDGGVHTCPDGSTQTYLVMELVEGSTLHDVLDHSPTGTDVVARVGIAVASGLAHIHSRGVIHRDVKPANILLPRADGVFAAGDAKLGDFGIARAGGTGRLTELGLFVGTAGYVSPEQVRGEELGPASDVYSLALVLIEMITGNPVYPGGDVTAATARLYRRPSVPTVGYEWTELLRAMCHDDPARRPGAAEVVRRLSTMPTGRMPATDPTVALAAPGSVLPVGGTAVLDEQPRPAARHRRRRPVLPWLAAAAVVAALAIGGLLLSRAGGSPVPAPSNPQEVAGSRTSSADRSTGSATASPSGSPTGPATPSVSPAARVVVPTPPPHATVPQGKHGNGKTKDKHKGKG